MRHHCPAMAALRARLQTWMESLGRVGGVEHRPERLAALRRHAGLVLEAGRRTIENAAGLVDFGRRRARYFPAL